MILNWYGEGCLKAQTGGITLVTDPFDASVGLTPPRGNIDVIVRTSVPLPIPYRAPGGAREVVGPGEYEVRGVEISGFSAPGSGAALKTFFRIVAEEIRIGLVAFDREGGEQVLDKLGELDLLIVPAGGAPFLSIQAVARLIKQINPKVVIPTFFKVPGLKRKAAPLDAFLGELGQRESPPLEKAVLKRKDLTGPTRVVVLKP